jgi:predicted nucleotidyltransferase
MNKDSEIIAKISSSFSELEEVEGVLLSGSLSTNTQDEHSDIDLYIYSDQEIPPSKRKLVLDAYSDYMEINNQYWETEDDGELRSPQIGIEIIYRNFGWIENELERTLVDYETNVGYSTCFWSNYLHSEILYDRDSRLKTLQEKVTIEFPFQLKKNIIAKNYPLLRDSITSYYFQIQKSLKRNDYISINHRVAALLASYFDVLFAINELPHPGEKKLISIIQKQCNFIPNNMEVNINRILANNTDSLLEDIHTLIDNLDTLLEQQQMLPLGNKFFVTNQK